jgi:threonine/homoserine/homoserine lactone efflux protein
MLRLFRMALALPRFRPALVAWRSSAFGVALLLLGCAGGDEVAARAASSVGSVRLLLALLLGAGLSFAGSLPMTGPLALLVLDRAVARERASAFWIACAGALVEGGIAGAIGTLLPLVLRHSTAIVLVARVGGAVVILAVGVSLLVRPQMVTELKTERKRESFVAGLLATALNPTLIATWTVTVTALNANGLLDGGLRAGSIFGAGVAAGVLGWCGLVLWLSRADWTERLGRYRTRLGRSIGGILVLVAVLILLRVVFGGN